MAGLGIRLQAFSIAVGFWVGLHFYLCWTGVNCTVNMCVCLCVFFLFLLVFFLPFFFLYCRFKEVKRKIPARRVESQHSWTSVCVCVARRRVRAGGVGSKSVSDTLSIGRQVVK